MRTLLALCLLAVAQPALAGTHSISSQVTDRNGTGLGRTRITLSPSSADAKPNGVDLVTDREGRFLVDYLRDPEGERTKLGKKTEYVLEVFKPGFHPASSTFFYKKGELTLDAIVLVEETIEVEDVPENLDPATDPDGTHAAGANYEGQ
jgi:hypothetical protein